MTSYGNKRKIEDKEKLPPLPDYEPTAFLRCHSSENDPNDNLSKVWRSAFEPSLQNPGESSYILASCGSKIVNLIDCRTGKVMKRYNDPDSNESFYTLAWSTLPIQGKTSKCNILAVAGEGCRVKLLYPTQLVMYSTLTYHKKYISCLLFHSTKPNYLFSGSRDGWIVLWDIGIPDITLQTKNNNSPLLRFSLPDINSDALNLAYSSAQNILIAACENGCIGWKLDDINKQTKKRNKIISQADYIFVKSDVKQTIDGLIMLTDDIIASKQVGTGLIQLWSIKENINSKKSKSSQTIKPLLELEYTSTTVDYLNFGYTPGMLCVGDDVGNIYLYNLKNYLKKNKSQDSLLAPSQIIEWPEISVDGKSDIDSDAVPVLDKQKIVVNCVSVSSNQEYIVYGTDTNLLCIWKRC
ncbi:hypothetical protein SNE40_006770 [Patella caerulea]|uniref:Leucine-rich repeat and WD repeat-containing protein 1 WD domain-containing protein n=1 Tax=Patella caerulea TaxID=87958 RepID=A0AAN8JX62_PATCE